MTSKKNSKIKRKNNISTPGIIHAALGSTKGEINLHWDAISKARNYVLQAAVNNLNNWKHVDIISEPQYTLSGLVTGKKYYFRIAPVFDSGQGQWSQHTEKGII
jgi:fibronectin type III domain protein